MSASWLWWVPLVTLAACGSGGRAGADDGAADATTGRGPDAGRDAVGRSQEAGGDAGPADGGAPSASVLMYHNHLDRDGTYVDPAITARAAATFTLDTSFSGAVSGKVYASPLYVENGVGDGGTFYVATEGSRGSPDVPSRIYALAESTGAELWHHDVATPPNHSGAGCGNIHPIGITGTPAIDLATRLIVFDSASANDEDLIATHTIYGMSIDDGTVKWQVDTSTLRDTETGLEFVPHMQNQRGAVLIVGGIAYLVYGGHAGDCGTYHGWVVGVPLTGQDVRAWATRVEGAGIWGPSGPASDGQSIFVSTGNGIDGPVTWAESEGVFRLDPGPSFTGQTADYFAPYNWQSLDDADLDLSGAGPLVIDAPSMTPPALVLAQGKDGWVYLLDRSNLGGIATSTRLASVGALQVQTGQLANGGAWATIAGQTYAFVRPNGGEKAIGCPAGTGGDLVAVLLDPSAPQKMRVAWCADTVGNGSPTVTTSDGTNDALVWIQGAHGSGEVRAFDLTTGKVVYDGAGSAVSGIHHFQTLIAVHGKLLAAGDGALHRWGP